MKVYELLIVVNFLVMLIVVFIKGNPLKSKYHAIIILWIFYSALMFLATFIQFLENNLNLDFLTYKVF